ncbi:type II toxin-antitoxin system ParD family antitoxin [Rhizobium puerariae]|uniref:Type II toxin-antitoxin system ParD family antitoxin n=1 Tax=Rhizobium puerariae TaxID=1585791 RepID=A0ABV6API7_9HYPH
MSKLVCECRSEFRYCKSIVIYRTVQAKEQVMARAKTFSLGDTYDGILSDLVKSGRFGTETEVVRAGIRMLADYEMRMQSLRQAIHSADAEIEAGLGKEYASGADLLHDVMNEDADN